MSEGSLGKHYFCFGGQQTFGGDNGSPWGHSLDMITSEGGSCAQLTVARVGGGPEAVQY